MPRIPISERTQRTFHSECRGVPVHVTEEIQSQPAEGEDPEAFGAWLIHYTYRATRPHDAHRRGVPFPISETGYRSDFYHGAPLGTEAILDRLDAIASHADKSRAKTLRYMETRVARASGPAPDPGDARAIRGRQITLDPTNSGGLASTILTLSDDEAGRALRQRTVRAALACLDAIEALPIPTASDRICGGREVTPEAMMHRTRSILDWRHPLTAALDTTGESGTLCLFGGGGPDFGPLLDRAPRLGILPEATEAEVPAVPC